MARIVILGERIGFREVALKELLVKNGYDAFTNVFNVNELHGILKDTSLVLFFITESVESDMAPLVFLKDQLLEYNIILFTVGNLNHIEKTIPRSLVSREYDYYYDKEKLLEDIDMTINVHKDGRRKRILVIDDSGVTLRNVKSVLEAKYDVQIANSAINGIKCMSIHKPDLILLDYDMPICNGKMALEMIRQEPSFGNVPVFFLTGRSDRKTVLEVMALKPNGYILKESGADRMVSVVDEFFEQL